MPPCNIPQKHYQLRTACPKATGNAFQAPLDPSHDGNNLFFDVGDERANGSDDNAIINAHLCDSGQAVS
jgi:hypothetical protein